MQSRNTKALALCGVTAALAVVMGTLAGMIPVATYVIPTLQCLVLQLILSICGKRFAWSWYACVGILNLLLCPDKEAAAVFAFLGYYPILKPWFDGLPASLLWKLLFFLVSTAVLYSGLIFLLGMDQLMREFADLGLILGVVTLVLGCATFLLLDLILTRFKGRLS